MRRRGRSRLPRGRFRRVRYYRNANVLADDKAYMFGLRVTKKLDIDQLHG